jgi:POT family proton-dependent oligopeptide transporter
MWERFSYYGMRALLVPYMVSAAFGYQPGQASGVYKWYTSLVYLAPLAGGFLADRFLGLRNAVMLGAILMAIGHFLMALPSQTIFFAALGFLIAGNGFFKPNISTMIGKMYTPKDLRRDGAFTIFYMGINIGAFLASIVCPLLQEKIGFHWGFGAAGVGMVVGLMVFLFGQSRVVKDVLAVGNHVGPSGRRKVDPIRGQERVEVKEPGYREASVKLVDQTDADLPGRTGFAGMVGKIYPFVMMAAGPLIVALYVHKVMKGEAKPIALIMPVAFGAIFIGMGILLTRLRGAQKDKSVSIFLMFLFPVFFWMAFEQAGNALNLWAVVHTDRVVGGWEYPAGWWQSANAFFIFVLAPLFSLMWMRLGKAGKEPATAGKMFWAMAMMVASFGIMIVGAARENATETRVSLSAAPKYGDVSTFDATRMRYDAASKELVVRGVLPEFAVRDALEKSSEPALVKEITAFAKASDKATKASPVTQKLTVPRFQFTTDAAVLNELKLQKTPTGALESEKLTVQIEGTEGAYVVNLTARAALDAQPRTELYAALAEPEWKKALYALQEQSKKARVSGVWLLLSYLLATLGELCLSPVGLSMVTKLAPARFASLFMGVWLLSSSVAQYVGGSIGESWGQIPPTSYFTIFVGTSLVGVMLVLILRSPLKKLMHDVN